VKNKREKGREREKESQTLDRAARKVCPNDKGISAVIKGTCQISLHSRGSYRMLFADEGGRRETGEDEGAFHVRRENSKAWDFTCINASLLAKKGKKRGEEDPATVLPG